MVDRVIATPATLELIKVLQAKYGPKLFFHQSGGCCDNSAANCYHHYPAHAAFGGYKESGLGRENHKMMLNHYQQTKNLLVSYSEQKLGFF